MKIIATNRKAKRDYNISETYEAGIELKGDEVKSLRNRNCSIEDAFARVEGAEVYLYNMHILEFNKSSYFKSVPTRVRKLLIRKKEIKRLIGLTAQRGFTLVPLQLYFNDKGWAKIEIALAKGRRTYDKRRKMREEIEEKEARRALKKFRHGG